MDAVRAYWSPAPGTPVSTEKNQEFPAVEAFASGQNDENPTKRRPFGNVFPSASTRKLVEPGLHEPVAHDFREGYVERSIALAMADRTIRVVVLAYFVLPRTRPGDLDRCDDEVSLVPEVRSANCNCAQTGWRSAGASALN